MSSEVMLGIVWTALIVFVWSTMSALLRRADERQERLDRLERAGRHADAVEP